MDWATRIRLAKAASRMTDPQLAERAAELDGRMKMHTWRVIISFVGNGHLIPTGRIARILEQVVSEVEAGIDSDDKM